jgi:hypothetical protein
MYFRFGSWMIHDRSRSGNRAAPPSERKKLTKAANRRGPLAHNSARSCYPPTRLETRLAKLPLFATLAADGLDSSVNCLRPSSGMAKIGLISKLCDTATVRTAPARALAVTAADAGDAGSISERTDPPLADDGLEAVIDGGVLGREAFGEEPLLRLVPHALARRVVARVHARSHACLVLLC